MTYLELCILIKVRPFSNPSLQFGLFNNFDKYFRNNSTKMQIKCIEISFQRPVCARSIRLVVCGCQLDPGWVSKLMCNYLRFMIKAESSVRYVSRFACKRNPHFDSPEMIASFIVYAKAWNRWNQLEPRAYHLDEYVIYSLSPSLWWWVECIGCVLHSRQFDRKTLCFCTKCIEKCAK